MTRLFILYYTKYFPKTKDCILFSYLHEIIEEDCPKVVDEVVDVSSGFDNCLRIIKTTDFVFSSVSCPILLYPNLSYMDTAALFD